MFVQSISRSVVVVATRSDMAERWCNMTGAVAYIKAAGALPGQSVSSHHRLHYLPIPSEHHGLSHIL